MKRRPLIRILFWGMLISFLGSLPLGPLNLFTTYISESKGIAAAFEFGAGCIIVELIYVRITLKGMNWLQNRKKLFKFLEWISVIIITGLAIFCFYAAYKNLGFISGMTAVVKYPFLSGLLFSLLEPMKIPFWFVWTTFLFSNKSLLPVSKYYNNFVAGIGLGSLFGFIPFAFAGNFLITTIKTHQQNINLVTGIILLITALIQVYRNLKNAESNIQKENLAVQTSA